MKTVLHKYSNTKMRKIIKYQNNEDNWKGQFIRLFAFMEPPYQISPHPELQAIKQMSLHKSIPMSN